MATSSSGASLLLRLRSRSRGAPPRSRRVARRVRLLAPIESTRRARAVCAARRRRDDHLRAIAVPAERRRPAAHAPDTYLAPRARRTVHSSCDDEARSTLACEGWRRLPRAGGARDFGLRCGVLGPLRVGAHGRGTGGTRGPDPHRAVRRRLVLDGRGRDRQRGRSRARGRPTGPVVRVGADDLLPLLVLRPAGIGRRLGQPRSSGRHGARRRCPRRCRGRPRGDARARLWRRLLGPVRSILTGLATREGSLADCASRSTEQAGRTVTSFTRILESWCWTRREASSCSYPA